MAWMLAVLLTFGHGVPLDREQHTVAMLEVQHVYSDARWENGRLHQVILWRVYDGEFHVVAWHVVPENWCPPHRSPLILSRRPRPLIIHYTTAVESWGTIDSEIEDRVALPPTDRDPFPRLTGIEYAGGRR